MVAKTRYSAAHSRTSGLEFTLYGAHMPSCFSFAAAGVACVRCHAKDNNNIRPHHQVGTIQQQ